MASKSKNVFLYHPLCIGDDGISFAEVIDNMLRLGSDFNVTARGVKSVLGISASDDWIIISLQNLSNDDLPKIANDDDGKDEKEIDIPEGKSLSYRNCFVFNRKSNLLGAAKLSLCPHISRLAGVFNKVISENFSEMGVSKNLRVRFSQIFEKGLGEKLRNARTITMAQVTSLERSGENISEKDFGRYKDFMGGVGYTKTTKLHGNKGANIKHLVQFILDDIIQGNDFVEDFQISMKVDGEAINFNQYYKKYIINVDLDDENRKYVDYDCLIKAVIGVMEQYEG